MEYTTSPVPAKFLSKPSELGVIAVGFSAGQGHQGVDTGPQALIDAGLLTQLHDELHYTVHHDGQIHNYQSLQPAKGDAPHRGMKNPRAVSAATRQLAEQVYEQAVRGRMVLTLGGDHSIAIGTIAGSARAARERLGREIAVIWVDAHADINTPEISGSGNIHGMPVAFLTGLAREDDENIFGWLERQTTSATNGSNGHAPDSSTRRSGGIQGGAMTSSGTDRTGARIVNGGEGTGAAPGVLSLKKLVYIGLRDVDAGEKQILRQHGIRAFSMHDIDRHGIGRVMEMALGVIGTDTPIHLSFDVDALDPQWAPSTGTPVRGGLTLREGDYIAECVAATGSLVAMDLVEVNPSLEAKGAAETVRAGCSLIRCALGDTLL